MKRNQLTDLKQKYTFYNFPHAVLLTAWEYLHYNKGRESELIVVHYAIDFIVDFVVLMKGALIKSRDVGGARRHSSQLNQLIHLLVKQLYLPLTASAPLECVRLQTPLHTFSRIISYSWLSEPSRDKRAESWLQLNLSSQFQAQSWRMSVLCGCKIWFHAHTFEKGSHKMWREHPKWYLWHITDSGPFTKLLNLRPPFKNRFKLRQKKRQLHYTQKSPTWATGVFTIRKTLLTFSRSDAIVWKELLKSHWSTSCITLNTLISSSLSFSVSFVLPFRCIFKTKTS